MHFACEQEERADEGVQRHIWWSVPLPGAAAGSVAYISPMFDAFWTASSFKLLTSFKPERNESCANHGKFQMHGVRHEWKHHTIVCCHMLHTDLLQHSMCCGSSSH